MVLHRDICKYHGIYSIDQKFGNITIFNAFFLFFIFFNKSLMLTKPALI